MRHIKTWLLGFIGLALILASLVWAFQREVATALMKRVAHTQVGRNTVAGLPDGLHLALCGTGSPFPDPSRAGPCSAIIAGKRIFLVDAGEGAAKNLGQSKSGFSSFFLRLPPRQ